MPKTAIIKCDSYEKEKVFQAMKKGLELLGGLEKFVKPDEKVLIKPNLLTGKPPEKQATTHPAVFEALIRCLKEKQYKIFYGDSPGLVIGTPEKVAEQADLKQVADKHEIPNDNFTSGKTVQFPDGQQCKQFPIAQAALEADAIISLSKMKTHQLTRITGAVKNQFGCVYGFHKGAFHVKFSDAISFSKMLVDLNKLLKPKLYIMDGIMAMEGNGPGAGDPVAMNVLLMSEDPVALDATFCRLINLDPEYVPTNTFGKKYELGTYAENEIELVGDPLPELVNKNFSVQRVPVKNERVKFVQKLFKNFLLRKPIIDPEKCIKCGICVDACPLKDKALNFPDDSKKSPPKYTYKKCIRCYCCQEMCPQKAIYVKTPILGKLLLYRK